MISQRSKPQSSDHMIDLSSSLILTYLISINPGLVQGAPMNSKDTAVTQEILKM